MKTKRKKNTIGRKDKADFPALGLQDLDVKVDTGAYTSSIHCHNVELVYREGEFVVAADLLDPQHPAFHGQKLIFKGFRSKMVKSSNGLSEKRVVVKTRIILFGKDYAIELSLSNRSNMRSPVLLGRTFLKRNFVVDPAKKNLSFRHKNSLPRKVKIRKS